MDGTRTCAHAIASRGGWDGAGRWVPVPFVDPGAAERLFRHRVLSLLREEGLLSQERIELLLSWRRSGFSAHNAVTVAPEDTASIGRLGRYLLRAPVAVERLRFEAGEKQLAYQPSSGSHPEARSELFEPADFLARRLQHVPEPRLHQVRYYGHYSNVARARRAAGSQGTAPIASSGVGAVAPPDGDAAAEPTAAERRRLRRLWARLLHRIYEVDPLVCGDCGGTMRILSFVLEPAAIRKILAHLHSRARHPSRAPPEQSSAPTRAAS